MIDKLKIGALAKYTDCSVETIRFYEQKGLLHAPARTEGNYRLYDDKHRERLLFIRHCRSLDMTLDEIGALLEFLDAPEENCVGVNSLLDLHINHVEERIAELNALKKQLKNLQRLCDDLRVNRECGILNELTAEASQSPKSRKSEMGHVHGSHVQGKRRH